MAGKKFHIFQRKMHNSRNEKHLGGDRSTGSFEPVENHPFMGGMFVDEDQVPAALHDNIGSERLSQNPVFGNGRCFRNRN